MRMLGTVGLCGILLAGPGSLFSACAADEAPTASSAQDASGAPDGGDAAPSGVLSRFHVGFRSSRYAFYNTCYPFPTPEEFVKVAKDYVSRVPGSVAGAAWIVGVMDVTTSGQFTGYVNVGFPAEGKTAPSHVHFASEDLSEAYLTAFDGAGVHVWLQVEPGQADVGELADLVLGRYGGHPSVVGFGVDVEWNKYRLTDAGEGTSSPVTDVDARAWLAKVRARNPSYTLFLKHWEPSFMPPTEREGLLFIDDSLDLGTRTAMFDEFSTWGSSFEPAPVGFQIGYGADKVWWGPDAGIADPPGELAKQLQSIPNCRAVLWVDFSLH